MCTFITLIAASDDLARINAILATLDQRGCARRAERDDTPSLRPHLARDEREYLLLRPPCDCGTFLGNALWHSTDPDAARAADLARYRRKGWSEARIARAMADKHRDRPPRSHPKEDAAYWITLMIVLGEGLGLSRLGLMHHFRNRDAGPAPDVVARCEAGPVADATEVLARMPDGVIHDFHIVGRR
ncbi:hypothetical protein LY56_01754 [Roseinatronobacter thiooxidans]|uniref:Uncharacterized protein n=2 Tax=Roseinatronobacter thiooxidans TaxID=121821 RepID=A0A2W7QA29_9RHOB|nr:hypothetical protein [Roseinatronobacter thiooxidans]PZX44506.1 hypothetical protein LY56_01754 [Roseinatronobacter thiooxidans]